MYGRRLRLTVLTWNLFHGRARPPAGRSLLPEFARALAGWDWDVAALQEVPPWWGDAFGHACRAQVRTALTSRNALAPARRAVASRRPDLLGANGGGANVILARRPIGAHARRRLRAWPERRVVHAVALTDGGWFANTHLSTHPGARVKTDLGRAGHALDRWAAGGWAVLAGDLNLRHPDVPGFEHAAGHEVDHVLVRRGQPWGTPELLDAGGLSDHAPLRVALSAGAPPLPPRPAARTRGA